MAEDSIEWAQPPMRASDADRQRVADVLREHTTAGRLTIEEYDQRVDAAYAARTVPELRRLLTDLPVRIDDVLAPDVPKAPPQRAYDRQPPRADMARWAGLAVALVIMIGLVVLTRGRFVFFPLLLGGWFLFGGRLGGRRRHHH